MNENLNPENTDYGHEELDVEKKLRPLSFGDFTGQDQILENLQIFVQAANQRGEALDHTLFHGPPGLGKTTIANVIANELGVSMRSTSVPVIEKAGDLAAFLTNLQPHDVLFIDEIHRMSPAVEEVLYPAMEDFQLDLIIGEGPAARSVRIDLPPFTLVGATTRSGLLTTPLRDRFGIPLRLRFYEPEELVSIVSRGARLLNFDMTEEGAMEIARRSRGTPRIAGRLLRRVRDFAFVAEKSPVDKFIADAALTRLEVDNLGLDSQDRRYLNCIAGNYGGGPVGADRRLTDGNDLFEELNQIGLDEHVFDEILIIETLPVTVCFFSLLWPVAKDVVYRVHYMVHVNIFQFFVIHRRMVEMATDLIVKMAIGVF